MKFLEVLDPTYTTTFYFKAILKYVLKVLGICKHIWWESALKTLMHNYVLHTCYLKIETVYI